MNATVLGIAAGLVLILYAYFVGYLSVTRKWWSKELTAAGILLPSTVLLAVAAGLV